MHFKSIDCFIFFPDDISDNTIDGFQGAKVNKDLVQKKHKELKNLYKSLEKDYDYFDSLTKEDRQKEFSNPKVYSLWTMAKKANFSEMELSSLRVNWITTASCYYALLFEKYWLQSLFVLALSMPVAIFLQRQHFPLCQCLPYYIWCQCISSHLISTKLLSLFLFSCEEAPEYFQKNSTAESSPELNEFVYSYCVVLMASMFTKWGN